MADLTSNTLCVSSICYNAGLRCCAIGSCVEGGYLLCKQGGVALIYKKFPNFQGQPFGNWYQTTGLYLDCYKTSSGYSDWYIPSRHEMVIFHECGPYSPINTNQMYSCQSGVWFQSDNSSFWTSNQFNTSHAYMFCTCNIYCWTCWCKNPAVGTFTMLAVRRAYY